MQAINDTTLADIIKANSSVTNLQPNVFFFDINATPVVKTSAVVPTYSVGAAPIAVDPFVLVFDTQNLAGATVAITNYQPGDKLAVSQPLPAGISLASNAVGVLTLTGTASAASYQTALASITFSTTSFSDEIRTVAFTDTDGSLTSSESDKSIVVVPLAVDPWQNSANPLDVDNNGAVTPLDALAIINYLNKTGAGQLPANFSGAYYYDVNGDGLASPIDALSIINYLKCDAAAAPAIVTPAASAPRPLQRGSGSRQRLGGRPCRRVADCRRTSAPLPCRTSWPRRRFQPRPRRAVNRRRPLPGPAPDGAPPAEPAGGGIHPPDRSPGGSGAAALDHPPACGRGDSAGELCYDGVSDVRLHSAFCQGCGPRCLPPTPALLSLSWRN